eukprot:GFUD01055720.1.p1 GENE.GFUD01055720.1~~GFUD01055720.1.p1  ORF type:complete len:192 (-),score=47.27 GFUD01055720.1:453-1028(-)
MASSNPFRNANSDSEDEDEDPTKAFKTIWVGIANSTSQNLKVATWTHCSVPDTTSDFKLGAGLGVELTGAPVHFEFEKKARKLKQENSGGPSEPKDLAAFDWGKFVVNSDTHNASKIITVYIMKANATDNAERFWTIDIEHKHGVIVVEQDGQMKVVRANGQYWDSDRWKPHKSYKDPSFPKTFDPRRKKK